MPVAQAEEVAVNVRGSSVFGRYPKISLEKTYNLFITDEWLVNYAGFKKASEILPEGEGRGFFKSVRGGFAISVVASTVYKLQNNLAPQFVGQIDTSSGEVFIDENLSNQICIVDGDSAYIYNYIALSFTKQSLVNPITSAAIIPNYVTYHNSFFLIASAANSANPQNWYAFSRASDSTISTTAQDVFPLQTKPDSALAVVRLPGRGNNVLVLGSTVGEVWTQVGSTENYRRVQSFNIDSGVVAVSTIAASEERVCWLSQNQNNAPCIMTTNGSATERISTDGIDHLLQTIIYPDQSTAFFFRQDGHLFYQITFFNPADNLSLIYDFNTGLFFHVSDEDLNFHPARQIIYFNEKTYFISLNDASIYDMSTDYVTYDYDIDVNSIGEEIPRIRICKSIRKKDASRFRVGEFTFWIEQGVNQYYLLNPDEVRCNGVLIIQEGNGDILTQEGDQLLAQDGSCLEDNNRPRVDMSISKNGNQSFSNIVSKQLNPAGKYRNRIRWHRLGQANEFTVQLRFWGFQRFVVNDGVAQVY